MAEELDIISDEDLQAPLAMSKNYSKLADTFDDVVISTTKLQKSLQEGVNTTKEQREAAEKLVKEQKNLDKANEKAAKSQKEFGHATEFANEQTGGMINRVKDLSKQFLALLANPVGAFLLLIAGAVASVGAYFKTTNEGADKFEKIMAAIHGVIDFLTNKIAALGEQIVKLFEDGNVLGDIFIGIFNTLINVISGVIDSFTNLLKIINILAQYNLKDIITGNLKPEDVKALKQAMIDLGKAGVQAFTGIGSASEEAAAKVKSLAALTEAADKLGDEMRDRILSKAKAELIIEKALFDAKDKTNKTDAQRLQSLELAINTSKEQLKIDIDLANRKEKLFTAEILHRTGIINSEAEANKILAQGTTLLQDQLLEQKAVDKELETRRQLQSDVINLERSFFAENKKAIGQIGALQKEIDDESIARAEKEVDARIRIFDAQLQASKEVSGGEILGLKSNLDQQEDLTKRFNQRLIDDAKARKDAEKEIEKQKTQDLKDEVEKRKELLDKVNAGIAIAQVLAVGFIEQRRAKLDEDFAKSEDQREKELANAGDNEQKKLAINRKFDREQAKIKRKQAEADKQAALFNILISTAAGIARVAPNPVLIALVASIGLIQSAFVAAKSIPQFWMGSNYTPDTFIAGDRGREIVSRNGKNVVADRPTMFTGMAGSKVFANKPTEEILGNMSDVGYALNYGNRVRSSTFDTPIVAERLNENNRWLKKIANKPEASLVIDEEGFHAYSGKVARRNDRINKRFYGR